MSSTDPDPVAYPGCFSGGSALDGNSEARKADSGGKERQRPARGPGECCKLPTADPGRLKVLFPSYFRQFSWQLNFLLGFGMKKWEYHLIYINDIVELLARFNIKVKLFADDVKLYVKVVNDVDISVLQEALATLVLWADHDEWQLSISTDKCGVLHIGKGKGNITDKFYINSLAYHYL